MNFRKGVGEARREALWFGTVERAGWFHTPSAGADASPVGWDDSGVLLNGGGYVFDGVGSHKQYTFEWDHVSPATAQRLKSFADGSFGKGLLHFVLPNVYSTNVLPAHWGDPSMGVGFNGLSLVYGVEPEGFPVADNRNGTPVQGAFYNLVDVQVGFRGLRHGVFVPIPEGFSLVLGAMYSATGSGGVFVSPVHAGGVVGAGVRLTELSTGAEDVVVDPVSGARGAYVWVGKDAVGAGTVSLRGMVGRLVRSELISQGSLGVNVFGFSSLNRVGGEVEVHRNFAPVIEPSGQMVEVARNRLKQSYPSKERSGWSASSGVDVRPSGGGSIEVDFSETGGSFTSPRFVVNSGDIVYATIPILAVTVAGNSSALYTIRFLDAGGQVLSEETVDDSSGGNIQVMAEAPIGAVEAEIVMSSYPGPVILSIDLGDGVTVAVNSPRFTPIFEGVDSVTGETGSWAGTPYDSELVVSAESVADYMADDAVAIYSDSGGTPAVRLIPTGPNPRLAYEIPVPARHGGTIIGAGDISVEAPNESGTGRLFYGALTSDYEASWHGDPDEETVLTDLGIYATRYEGVNLKPGVNLNDTDLWLEQDGDNMITKGTSVDGFTGANNMVAIQSQNHSGTGYSSVRLIPTGAKASIGLDTPNTVLDGSTFVADFVVDGTGTATVGIYGAQNHTQSISTGTVYVRCDCSDVPLVEITSNMPLYMTLPTLIEGDNYNGPPFTGGYTTGVYVSSWLGLPNESSSELYHYPAELRELFKGPWIGGQGHSGCRFVGKPTYIERHPGVISMAATLKEVGTWAFS